MYSCRSSMCLPLPLLPRASQANTTLNVRMLSSSWCVPSRFGDSRLVWANTIAQGVRSPPSHVHHPMRRYAPLAKVAHLEAP